MILPIVAYGNSILKAKAKEIDEKYLDLKQLISDMFETMTLANGVGLAAPQIGKSIRLFIIKTEEFDQVFINPIILEETGDDVPFEEGCLSIPSIHEVVVRKSNIVVQYYDENFEFYEEEFSGMAARIIQHEYDHIEGKLFIEKINTLKRTLIKGRLKDIANGLIRTRYKMKF